MYRVIKRKISLSSKYFIFAIVACAAHQVISKKRVIVKLELISPSINICTSYVPDVDVK